MDRRRFLALAAGALGMAGCTDPAAPQPDVVAPTAPGPTDRDAALREAAVATELALITGYREVIDALADPPPQLRLFLADHLEHLARMSPEQALPMTASPVADRPSVRRLQRLEVRARKQHVDGCDAAGDPGLARDLCLMAGSEAQHATLLPALRRQLATDA